MMKSKIGEALAKFSKGSSAEEDPDADMEDAEEEDAPDSSDSAEVDAMKLFEKAGSPQEKARAMKLFLKACGAY